MSKALRHKIALAVTIKEKRKQRRRMICGGLIAAVIVSFLAGVFFLRGRSATKDATNRDEAADIKQRYAQLNAIIAKAWIGVRGEPEAEALLRDFAQKAIIGKLSSYRSEEHTSELQSQR